MTALHDLAATELVAAFRSGALSPVETTRAVLAHIAACEPQLHATYALNPAAALAAAEASQARWLKNAPQGALDGVPVMIKENIATKGVPLPLGTAATELAAIPHDAHPPRACAKPAR